MSIKLDENKTSHHDHKGHNWMMAICCGLPIIGFLAIAVLGISLPSLGTALFLLCPIGMIAMMIFMHRDGCKSSRQNENGEPALTQDKARDEPRGSNAELGKHNMTTKTGWLEA